MCFTDVLQPVGPLTPGQAAIRLPKGTPVLLAIPNMPNPSQTTVPISLRMPLVLNSKVNPVVDEGKKKPTKRGQKHKTSIKSHPMKTRSNISDSSKDDLESTNDNSHCDMGQLLGSGKANGDAHPDVVPNKDSHQHVVPDEDGHQDVVPDKNGHQDVVANEDNHQDVVCNKDSHQDVVPDEDAHQDVITDQDADQDVVLSEVGENGLEEDISSYVGQNRQEEVISDKQQEDPLGAKSRARHCTRKPERDSKYCC